MTTINAALIALALALTACRAETFNTTGALNAAAGLSGGPIYQQPIYQPQPRYFDDPPSRPLYESHDMMRQFREDAATAMHGGGGWSCFKQGPDLRCE